MNEHPHSHAVKVTEFSWFWSIDYGDQPNENPSKPWRRPWDSDLAYSMRCARRLTHEVRKVVRKHDQQSILAGRNQTARQIAAPELDPTKWGSEQLG